jgi:hypothetical protein
MDSDVLLDAKVVGIGRGLRTLETACGEDPKLQRTVEALVFDLSAIIKTSPDKNDELWCRTTYLALSAALDFAAVPRLSIAYLLRLLKPFEESRTFRQAVTIGTFCYWMFLLSGVSLVVFYLYDQFSEWLNETGSGSLIGICGSVSLVALLVALLRAGSTLHHILLRTVRAVVRSFEALAPSGLPKWQLILTLVRTALRGT